LAPSSLLSREVKVESGSGSDGSTVGLDVHFPTSLRSTPQSESLGRVLASLPSSSPLPKDSSAFWSKFGLSSPPPFLQRSVLRPVEKAIFSELKERLSISSVSSSSFAACLAPSSRAWLLALPSPSLYPIASSALHLGFVWDFLRPILFLVSAGVLRACWKILDTSCPVRC
jgi:hypothetical protein